MRFEVYKKGKPLLYLPEITEKKGPYKVFFLSITEDYYKKGSYAKILVCIDENTVKDFSTIEEFRAKERSPESFSFNDSYKFIVDLNSVKEFKSTIKFKYEKMYLFLLEKEELYKKILKKSYLFRKDEPSLFYSPFYSNLKRSSLLFRFRFYLLCFLLTMKRMEIILYPFIFIIDLIKNNFQSFNAYMDCKDRLKDYNRHSMRSQMLFYAQTEQEFEKARKDIEKKYNDAKKHYLDSTINNLNLFIAIIGLLISIIINVLLVYTNNNENNQLKSSVRSMEILNSHILNNNTEYQYEIKGIKTEIDRKDEIINMLIDRVNELERKDNLLLGQNNSILEKVKE